MSEDWGQHIDAQCVRLCIHVFGECRGWENRREQTVLIWQGFDLSVRGREIASVAMRGQVRWLCSKRVARSRTAIASVQVARSNNSEQRNGLQRGQHARALRQRAIGIAGKAINAKATRAANVEQDAQLLYEWEAS